MDELSKYRQVAVDLANKNAIIDELKDRVDTLEELLVKKANVAIGNAELKALSEERRVTKNLEERLFKMETEVDGIKVDLGEVMFVYDDVQVGTRCQQSSSLLPTSFIVRIVSMTSTGLGRTT